MLQSGLKSVRNCVGTIIQNPTKYVFTTYFIGVFSYKGIMTYSDTKCFLTHFRNKTIDKIDFIQYNYERQQLQDNIISEWDAVRRGANYRYADNWFNALFWPIAMWEHIIPTLVLKLNPSENKKV